jgi:membrane protein YdbS with pleckstrin-like domain
VIGRSIQRLQKVRNSILAITWCILFALVVAVIVHRFFFGPIPLWMFWVIMIGIVINAVFLPLKVAIPGEESDVD